MKVFLVFSFVFLAVQLDSTHGVRKCSPEVLNKINLLWEKEGKPKDLLTQAVAAGKQNIIKTSKDYYPSGTTCAYTRFSKDGTSTTLTKVVLGKKDEENEAVYEEDSVVVDKGTGTRRYHVFSKDGVAAWYKCGNGVNANDGDPEGAIKVPNGITYNEDDVKTAGNKLKSIGVTLTKDYDSFC